MNIYFVFLVAGWEGHCGRWLSCFPGDLALT
jgi:hypothetical protein